ncbi:hypothetical protein BD769DRAFT_1438617 [Suillus cothurnatus]|nr:hypothetical protein BD769DRAFT_1438617 [Suillus cothurnatus]
MYITHIGTGSGLRNYARLDTLFRSPDNVEALSRSSRFTRFFQEQIFTYIACSIALLLTLVDFFLRSWETALTVIMAFFTILPISLDLSS